MQFTAAGQSAAEEAGTATITVQLSAASGRSVTVPYTISGTATSGADFTMLAGPLVIPAGSTSGTITVTLVNNDVVEPNETVIVTLGAPTNATLGTTGVHTLTITDTDAAQLSIRQDVSGAEDAAASLTFTIDLSHPVSEAISVAVSTTDGTATVADSDYTPRTNFLVTIPPGQTSATFLVDVTADTKREPNETFQVVLGAVTGGQGRVTASATPRTGAIENDDPVPTINAADLVFSEPAPGQQANANVQVTLTNPSSETITVAYATADGSATQPGDYTSAQGALTFQPGETTKTVAVAVKGNSRQDPDRDFFLNLTAPTGATLGDGQARIVVRDDSRDAVLSGFVYVDSDNDGVFKPGAGGAPGERGLAAVAVVLTGIDLAGNAVMRTVRTGDDGSYRFTGLPGGTYEILQIHPANFLDGKDTAGSLGGTAANDVISGITLARGAQGQNYNFGERGLSVGLISKAMFLASTPPAVQILRHYTDYNSYQYTPPQGNPTIAVDAAAKRVTVTGTPGDDLIAFQPGANGTPHRVVVNGTAHEYSTADVTDFVFHGAGGKDTASLTGSAAADTFVLKPAARESSVTGTGYSVTVDQIETIFADGKGGNDQVDLFDTAAGDALRAAGKFATLGSNGMVLSAVNFEQVKATSSTGRDRVSRAAIDYVLTLLPAGQWIEGS